jgi:DNA-binding NarL/FixJ family response regulator
MASTPVPTTVGDDLAPGSPRVVVADDHGLLRQGMRHLLNTEFPGCEVVDATTLDEALTALRTTPTDMLLLDLDMPGMQGPESVRSLRKVYPHLNIAVVSGSPEQQLIVDCLASGANGYILKEVTVDEVAYAIRSILAGYMYVTPSLIPTIDGDVPTAVLEPARFTARQMDVLRQLKLGQSNKEIARELRLSEGTVKIHLAAIFRLLRARNRTEAVVLAGQLKI